MGFVHFKNTFNAFIGNCEMHCKNKRSMEPKDQSNFLKTGLISP